MTQSRTCTFSIAQTALASRTIATLGHSFMNVGISVLFFPSVLYEMKPRTGASDWT